MYLVKTPQFIQKLFPNFVWKVPTTKKELYLTFDDGPTAEMTPWILEQLAEYDAKGTFFCVGQEIEKFPTHFQTIIDAGHTVGNHTFTHPNGWGAENISYFHDVRHCARLVNSTLFRPPYGKLMPKQVQFLERHYEIIMWDVMSGDFDENITKEECLENVVSKAKEGSIIVFHDNLKSREKLQYVLPKVLKHYAELGYTFKAVTASSDASEKLDKDSSAIAA
jgi:peptidoglycan/xylan/chitin deacetylase (PgdA/CDA1 family)